MRIGLPSSQTSFLEREGRGLLLLVVLWLALASVLPLAVLVRTAFGGAETTFLDLVQEWRRPSVQRAIFNSLGSSFGAMLVSLVLGGAAAIILTTVRVRGRRSFAFLFTLSMLVAPHVAALAFKTLLGPASPVLQAIGLAPPPGSPNPLLSMTGIVLVLGLHHAPIVMLTLLAGIRTIPHDLIEAAQVDGARPSRILRDLVMPLLAGHWLAAGLLAFVAAFGNFGIPALLGLPVNIVTLPTLIYRQLSSFGPNVLPDVAGLSLLTMLVGGLIIVFAIILLARRGTALEPERQLKAFWTPGSFMQAMIVMAGIAVLLVALILPLLSLLASSLVPSYGVALTIETFTSRAYAETLIHQAATREAFRTSLGLAGLAAFLLAIIALPMAFAIHRFARRSRALLMVLIELPYALPGIVIAIAAILLFLRPLPVLGISLYATPWIILAAYLVRFLPLAVKPALASMATLSPSMEEAGALCGARVMRRLTTLILPALLPSLCAGGLMVFLTAFSELTVSALLWSAGSRTLGVVVYGLEEAGLTTEASALSVVTVIVVGVVMAMIDALRPLLPDGSIPWFVGDDERTRVRKLS